MKAAQIYSKDFIRVVKSTRKILADNSSFPSLSYIRLEFDAESKTLTAIASNGFALAVSSCPCISVSQNFAGYIKPNFKLRRGKIIEIAVKDTTTELNFGNTAYRYQAPEDPLLADWKTIIPVQKPEFKIRFNSGVLLSVIKATTAAVKGTIELDFMGEKSPLLIRPVGKKSVEALWMVIPVQDEKDYLERIRTWTEN